MIKSATIKVNFNLRNPQSDKETPINLVARYNGLQIVHPASEKVHPLNWISDKTKGKSFQRARKDPALNCRLDDMKVKVQNAFNEFKVQNNRMPGSSEFKRILAKLFGQVEAQEIVGFVSFIENYIDESCSRLNARTGKAVSIETIKTYKTLVRHLKGYQSLIRREIHWEDLNQEFYRKFTYYLNEKGLKVNTVGKFWKNINACIRQAELRSIIKPGQISSFKVTKEKSDSIFLNSNELKALEMLDLSDNPRLDRVRDLFLVACYTGARYSDLHKYTLDAIDKCENGELFKITQQKTQQNVVVPVHAITKQVLEKYQGLPNIPSAQKMNQYLKELAYMIPELHTVFVKKCTQGGKNIAIESMKYELVCTHTARRSFATNQLKANIPVYLIMSATGHRTEDDFWKYVKMENHDKGNEMLKYWNMAAH